MLKATGDNIGREAKKRHKMVISKEEEEYLSKIYYDVQHEASFSTPRRLYEFVKKDGKHSITEKEVRQFLTKQEVHTTHKEFRKPKHFYHYVVPFPKYMVELDSFYFDFDGEKKKKFILGVDAFSRKAAAVPVDDLKAKNVNKAVQSIVQELQPQRVRFDGGKEYNSKIVLSTLRDQGIKYMVANPPYKASMVERLGKTVKHSLFKAMQASGTVHWSKLLPKVIKSYNARKHRMLGMSPNEAELDSNTADLWFKFRNRNWKAAPPPTDYKFEIGDPVRIVNDGGPLVKSFFETYSARVLFVSGRYSKANVHRYLLKDHENNPIQKRSFTSNQLVLSHVDDQTVYRIEKVLHRKLIGGELYAYVKWVGYSKRFNSYIPNKDVIDIGTES